MNGKIKIFLIAVVAVAVLGGAYGLYGALAERYAAPDSQGSTCMPNTGEIKVDPAVDFTVYDESGNRVSLSDYVGRPVVVNFWASWCSACKSEMPEFQKAYEDYEGEIVFLMVDLNGGGNDTKEAAQQVIRQNNYTFPVYYDSDSSAAYAYSIRSIPVTLFINKGGEVVARNTGAMSEEKLKQSLQQIYAPMEIG